jgi:hypothetical protein
LKKGACIVLAMIVFVLVAIGFIRIVCANSILWPDWTGISPIVSDTLGDESPNYDLADCYVTNDSTYLFFKIQVSGTDILKAATRVLLDVDQNANTGDNGSNPNTVDSELIFHDIGADYMLDPVISADLYQWNDIAGWQIVTGIPYSINGNSLELAVLLSDIGGLRQINIVFLSKPPDTDFAPDQGYVTYPRAKPVGGTIVPNDTLNLFTPITLTCLAAAAAGILVGFKKWKRI